MQSWRIIIIDIKYDKSPPAQPDCCEALRREKEHDVWPVGDRVFRACRIVRGHGRADEIVPLIRDFFARTLPLR